MVPSGSNQRDRPDFPPFPMRAGLFRVPARGRRHCHPAAPADAASKAAATVHGPTGNADRRPMPADSAATASDFPRIIASTEAAIWRPPRTAGPNLDGDGLQETGGDEPSAVGVAGSGGRTRLASVRSRAGRGGRRSRRRVGRVVEGVDLLAQVAERLTAPVGVVLFDRFAQALGHPRCWN